jgi:6-pyruvoyltetrahydropterin/6-carboxytetrahydropterin synthase
MFEVMIRTRFAAAHFLRGYAGRCESLHGHNWIVEVGVAGTTLDTVGLLLDFKVLKERVRTVLETLDHTLLNDHPFFQVHNPTSEHLARWLHEELSATLGRPDLRVSAIRVWESEDAVATYTPDPPT